MERKQGDYGVTNSDGKLSVIKDAPAWRNALKVSTVLASVGLVLLGLGGSLVLIGWHRTYGLGGLGLGVLLLLLGLSLSLKGRRGISGEGPKNPKGWGIRTRELVSVVMVATVGIAAFYGTTYLAGHQSEVSSVGSGTTSTRKGLSLTETSGSIQGSTSGCPQNPGASAGAPNPLRLDGSAINYNGTGTSSSVSVSTVNDSDLIILFVTILDNPRSSGTVPTTVKDIVGGQGTPSFLKRAVAVTKEVNAGVDKYSVEEWYAVANKSLANATITVELLGPSPAITIIAFGVSGVNVTKPFDPNRSLPATAVGSSGGSISVPICTDHPNDMIIGGAAMASASPGAAYNLIQSDNGKALVQDPIAEYKLVSSPQKDFQVTFTGQSPALAQTWAIIGDAIQSGRSCSPLGPCS